MWFFSSEVLYVVDGLIIVLQLLGIILFTICILKYNTQSMTF